MKLIYCFIFAVVAVSVACTPKAMNIQFDPTAFMPYQKEGTSTITGSAFLKTRGGEVKVGAGNVIELIPMTPYIRERFERIMVNGERLVDRDPRVEAFTRKTVADAQGNFEFKNIPQGDYALYCLIQWEVPAGIITTTTGGYAYASVHVEEGRSYRVIVTR